ncbi:uncharacterized protein EKO05_0000593 [Ascochyta rabiei]|uniref:Uncharacterized protein n=1 Tax=Didymella rabiei TaxID=5454 RepID=A0A163HH78_DIDRA|nr:uncharacterized protein EKO05_0000593 [Ascochyta rabiei]KZM25288.1 hypothetical protein ST47_g3517 [Ascochyta rabiei]UPX09915.1 hypothetical protein EKO05_0000593 [Ascochyta rabiei]
MANTNILGLTLTLTPAALTALRIAPLIGSTASLTHAYMEWLVTTSFLSPAPIHSATSRFVLGLNALPSPPAVSGQKPNPEEVSQTYAELEHAMQVVVPHWFTTFFNTALYSVVGFNTFTLVSASLNLLVSSSQSGGEESMRFYGIGLVAAATHYAFVPLVGWSVKALIGLCAGRIQGSGEAGREKKAVEWMREWVGWHRIRMATVDTIAWACFAWGVIEALTV